MGVFSLKPHGQTLQLVPTQQLEEQSPERQVPDPRHVTGKRNSLFVCVCSEFFQLHQIGCPGLRERDGGMLWGLVSDPPMGTGESELQKKTTLEPVGVSKFQL